MSPDADVDVTRALVAQLLAEQHPDLTDLTIEHLAHGWDNELFRIGDDLIGRFPRRQVSAELAAMEARWLPDLAPHLPVPIPVPVGLGHPCARYPWTWSLVRWIPGRALLNSGSVNDRFVDQLGTFLRTLHSIDAPPNGPVNGVRGVALSVRTSTVESNLTTLVERADLSQEVAAHIHNKWTDLLQVPPHIGSPQWVHGDMHPGNVVMSESGDLASVIDFGDLCVGDPACDLAIAWMMFNEDQRSAFHTIVCRDDDALWQRGRGWGLALGLVLWTNSAVENPLRDAGQRAVTEAFRD